MPVPLEVFIPFPALCSVHPMQQTFTEFLLRARYFARLLEYKDE